ncbi:unnamed protein product [Phytomonas sp. EM1]|nr:unnamed protein product [Phytomonas sp. EM1]|eukprot:CCW63323.1 unnamed protein product [Phytomonas sp. isolate EM1]
MGEALTRVTCLECQRIITQYYNPSIPPEAHRFALSVIVNIRQARLVMRDAESLDVLKALFLSSKLGDSLEVIELMRKCVSLLVSNNISSLQTLNLIIAANLLLRDGMKEYDQHNDTSEDPFTPFTTDSSLASSFDGSQGSFKRRTRRYHQGFPTQAQIRLATELLAEAARRLPSDYACPEDINFGEFFLQNSGKNYSFKDIASKSSTSSVHESEMSIFVATIRILCVIISVQKFNRTFDQNILQEIDETILRPVAKVLPRLPFVTYFSLIVKARPLYAREVSFLTDILQINNKSFIDICAQMLRIFYENSKPSNLFLGCTAAKAMRKWNTGLARPHTSTSTTGNENIFEIFDALAPLLETRVFFTKDFPEGVDFDMKRPFLVLRKLYFVYSVYTAFCMTTFSDDTVSLRYLGSLERVTQCVLQQLKVVIQDRWADVSLSEDDRIMVEIVSLRILINMYRARKLVKSFPVAGAEHCSNFIPTDELISHIKVKSYTLILLPTEGTRLVVESLTQQADQLLLTQEKFKIWSDLVTICLEFVETDYSTTSAQSSNVGFYIHVLQSLIVLVRDSKRSHFVLKTLCIALRNLCRAYSSHFSGHMERLSKGVTQEEGSTEADVLKKLLIESFNGLQKHMDKYVMDASMPIRKDFSTEELEKDSIVALSRIALSVAMEALNFSFLLGHPVSDLHSVPALESALIAALRSFSVGGEKWKERAIDSTLKGHDALNLLKLLESILRTGICSTNVLTAAATALRGAISEDALKPSWLSMSNVARAASRVYTLATPQLSISKGSRQVAQQGLICVTRLCLLNPPPNTGGANNDKTTAEELISRMNFAETVWRCAIQAVETPLRQCPLDKYLAIMLRHVRRYWMNPILKGLSLPKSMDEILSLEGLLKGVLSRNSDAMRFLNSSSVSISRDEAGKVLASHAFLIQANFLILSLIRRIRLLLMAIPRSDRNQQKARMKRYYDVCVVFSDIFDHNQNYMLPSVIYAALNEMLFLPSLFRRSGYYTAAMQRQLEFCLVCVLSYAEACGNQGTWALYSMSIESNRILDKGEAGEVVSGMETSEAPAKGNELLSPIMISKMFSEIGCIVNVHARRFLLKLVNEVADALPPPDVDDAISPESIRGNKPWENFVEDDDRLCWRITQGFRRMRKMNRFVDAG